MKKNKNFDNIRVVSCFLCIAIWLVMIVDYATWKDKEPVIEEVSVEQVEEKEDIYDQIERKLENNLLFYPKYIVLHHTATSTETTIDSVVASWQRRFWQPAAHYVIAYNWEIKKVLELEKNAGWTMNNWKNFFWIQIELIWNFNEVEPGKAQINSLRYLITEIEKKYWTLEIIWHREASPSACPWNNLDIENIKQRYTHKEPEWKEFSLSRYYSVLSWQNRYYN